NGLAWFEDDRSPPMTLAGTNDIPIRKDHSVIRHAKVVSRSFEVFWLKVFDKRLPPSQMLRVIGEPLDFICRKKRSLPNRTHPTGLTTRDPRTAVQTSRHSFQSAD